MNDFCKFIEIYWSVFNINFEQISLIILLFQLTFSE